MTPVDSCAYRNEAGLSARVLCPVADCSTGTVAKQVCPVGVRLGARNGRVRWREDLAQSVVKVRAGRLTSAILPS